MNKLGKITDSPEAQAARKHTAKLWGIREQIQREIAPQLAAIRSLDLRFSPRAKVARGHRISEDSTAKYGHQFSTAKPDSDSDLTTANSVVHMIGDFRPLTKAIG